MAETMTDQEHLETLATFLLAFGAPGEPLTETAEQRRVDWVMAAPAERCAWLGLTPTQARRLGYPIPQEEYRPNLGPLPEGGQ